MRSFPNAVDVGTSSIESGSPWHNGCPELKEQAPRREPGWYRVYKRAGSTRPERALEADFHPSTAPQFARWTFAGRIRVSEKGHSSSTGLELKTMFLQSQIQPHNSQFEMSVLQTSGFARVFD